MFNLKSNYDNLLKPNSLVKWSSKLFKRIGKLYGIEFITLKRKPKEIKIEEFYDHSNCEQLAKESEEHTKLIKSVVDINLKKCSYLSGVTKEARESLKEPCPCCRKGKR